MRTLTMHLAHGIKTVLAAAAALVVLASFTSCDTEDEQPQTLDTRGKKVITIGDSLTECCQWQPWLVEWLGIEWSESETRYGLDGHAPMAVGGTWVKPDSTNSIYLRSLDAKYYDPDIILLYVASNDTYSSWVSDGNGGTTYEEMVANEPPYRGDQVDKSISTLAAYKGMVENLMRDCPDAEIYLIGIMPIRCEVGMDPTGDFAAMYPSPRFPDIEAVKQWEMAERWPKHELVREVAEHYGLHFIDLWTMSGITNENAAQFYGDVAGDCTQVHPNEQGNKRVAECIRDYFTSGQG